MHSSGDPGDGCIMSGKVWNGKDGCLCVGHPSAAGASDRAGNGNLFKGMQSKNLDITGL